MRYTKHLWIFIVPLLLSGCLVRSGVYRNGSASSESLLETRYYHFFTEGTKHALFGNDKSAVDYYKKCIGLRPHSAAPHYQLSSIYLKHNQTDNALKSARNAVLLDSNNEWYQLQLANIYKYLGRKDSAIHYYNEVLKYKDSDELRYNLAMLYLESGNSKEALPLLTTMSNENENSKEVMLIKHNVYHRVKDYDSALFWLGKVTESFPEDINTRGMLAEYLTELGQYEKAKLVYKDLLQADSSNCLVLMSYAEYYLDRKLMDSANILLEKSFCSCDLPPEEKVNLAINLLGNQSYIVDNDSLLMDWMECVDSSERTFSFYAVMIDLSMSRQDFEMAKPYLDSALIYKKDNFTLWEQALLVNNMIGNDSSVAIIAKEAYDNFKDKRNLLLVRAYALRNLEAYDSAIVVCQQLINPDFEFELQVQGYMLLGELYRNSNEYAKSDSAFEKVLLMDPENYMVMNNYAYYLALRDDKLDRAEEMSKKALNSDPSNSTYLDTYGWVLYKLGKYDEAANYVAKAIRNGAYENSEVLEHYGDIMFKMHKCIEAREAYEAVIEMDSLYTGIETKLRNLNNCE